MENSSVIGRLSFLANVVGDGAVAGIQQMARGTGAVNSSSQSSRASSLITHPEYGFVRR